MRILKNNKFIYGILILAAASSITVPIVLKTINKNPTINYYYHAPLIKNKENLETSTTEIANKFQGNLNAIQDTLANWQNKSTTEGQSLKITTSNLNSSLELEKYLKAAHLAFAGFKIDPNTLQISLFNQFHQILQEYQISEIDIARNSITANKELIAKFDRFKEQFKSIILSIQNKALAANEYLKTLNTQAQLSNEIKAKLDQVSFAALSYFGDALIQLDKYQNLNVSNLSFFLNFVNNFFNTTNTYIAQFNNATDAYIASIDRWEVINNSNIKNLNQLKDMYLASVEVLSTYVAKNKALYELITKDSAYLSQVIANKSIDNNLKEMIYKTYLVAYANRLNLLTNALSNYFSSIIDLELLNEAHTTKFQKLAKEVAAIEAKNNEVLKVVSDVNATAIDIDIAAIFKDIYRVNFEIIDEIRATANEYLSSVETNNANQAELYKELNNLNNGILDNSYQLANLKSQLAFNTNQSTQIKELLKINANVLTTEEKANLNNKLTYLTNQNTTLKQGIAELENIASQLNIQYNEQAKELVKQLNDQDKAIFIIKHMNLALGTIFGQTTENNNLIANLRNQINSLVLDNQELQLINQNNLHEYNANQAKLQAELEKLSNQNQLATAAISNYEKQLKVVNSKIQELNAINFELSANIALLEENLANEKALAEINNNTNLTNITKLEQLLEAEIAKHNLVITKLNEAQEQKNQALEQIAALNAKIATLSANINNLQIQNQRLSELLASETTRFNNDRDNLNLVIENLNKSKAKLEEEIASLQATLANTTTNNEKLQATLAAKNKELQNLIDENSDLIFERELQAQELAKLQEINNDLKLRFETLNYQNNQRYNNLLAEYNETKTQLNNEIRELATLLQDEREENSRLLEKNIQFQNQIKDLIRGQKVYAGLVQKANNIITQSIALLNTFKETSSTSTTYSSTPAPSLRYETTTADNGYIIVRKPKINEYVRNLENYRSATNTTVIYSSNAKEVIAKALEILRTWELPSTIQQDISRILET